MSSGEYDYEVEVNDNIGDRGGYRDWKAIPKSVREYITRVMDLTEENIRSVDFRDVVEQSSDPDTLLQECIEAIEFDTRAASLMDKIVETESKIATIQQQLDEITGKTEPPAIEFNTDETGQMYFRFQGNRASDTDEFLFGVTGANPNNNKTDKKNDSGVVMGKPWEVNQNTGERMDISPLVGFRTEDVVARASALISEFAYHPDHSSISDMFYRGEKVIEEFPEKAAALQQELIAGNFTRIMDSTEQAMSIIFMWDAESKLRNSEANLNRLREQGATPEMIQKAEMERDLLKTELASIDQAYAMAGKKASDAMNIRKVVLNAKKGTFAGLTEDFLSVFDKKSKDYNPLARKITFKDLPPDQQAFIIDYYKRSIALTHAIAHREGAMLEERSLSELDKLLKKIQAKARKPRGPRAPEKPTSLTDILKKARDRFNDKFGTDRFGFTTRTFDPKNAADKMDIRPIVVAIARAIVADDVEKHGGVPTLRGPEFDRELLRNCRIVFGDAVRFGTTDEEDARGFRDIFTNYMHIKEATSNSVDKALMQIMGVERLISSLEDIEKKGLVPGKTGQQRVESSTEYTQLTALLHKRLKDLGFELKLPDPEHPERFLKRPVDIAKASYERAIKMYDEAIARFNEAIANGKTIDEAREIAEIKRNLDPLILDEEGKTLKAHRDALKERYEEIFAKELTDAEKIARLRKIYEKRLEKLNQELARANEGIFRGEPTNENDELRKDESIQRIMEQMDAVKEAIQVAADQAGSYYSTYQIARRSAIRQAKAKLKRYKEYIANPDLALKKQIRLEQDAITNDPEIRKLRADAEQAAKQWQEKKEMMAYEAQNWIGKAGSTMLAGKDVWKSILASMDLSAFGVQCAIAILQNPKNLKYIKDAVKAGLDSETSEAIYRRILEDPFYKECTVRCGVRISHAGSNEGFGVTEEAFARNAAAKKFGIVSDNMLLRASERAYVTPINLIRFSYCKRLYDEFVERTGRRPNDAEAKLLGRVVNMHTGRGTFFGDPSVTAAMSKFLWAPAKVFGQIESLTLGASLLFHLSEGKPEHEMAKLLYKECVGRVLVNTSIAYGIIYLVQSLLRDDDDDEPIVELNPLSTQFGKPNVGGRKFSITGGIERYISFPAQFIMQEQKTKYGVMKDTVGGALEGFIMNKATPHISTSYRLILGKLPTGAKMGGKITEKSGWLGEKTPGDTFLSRNGRIQFLIGNSIIPLTIKDLYDVAKDDGISDAEKIIHFGLTMLGYNSSDYGYNRFDADMARYKDARKLFNKAKPKTKEQYNALYEKNPEYARYFRVLQADSAKGLIQGMNSVEKQLKTEKNPNARARLMQKRDRLHLEFMKLFDDSIQVIDQRIEDYMHDARRQSEDLLMMDEAG